MIFAGGSWVSIKKKWNYKINNNNDYHDDNAKETKIKIRKLITMIMKKNVQIFCDDYDDVNLKKITTRVSQNA
jgi:hypothetical protein